MNIIDICLDIFHFIKKADKEIVIQQDIIKHIIKKHNISFCKSREIIKELSNPKYDHNGDIVQSMIDPIKRHYSRERQAFALELQNDWKNISESEARSLLHDIFPHTLSVGDIRNNNNRRRLEY